MVPQLTALVALSENPGLIPSTHMLQPSIIPVSEAPKPSSDFHGHQAHMWYTYIHHEGKTFIHIKA